MYLDAAGILHRSPENKNWIGWDEDEEETLAPPGLVQALQAGIGVELEARSIDISNRPGRVTLDHPTFHADLTPAEARQFAELLLKHANQAVN